MNQEDRQDSTLPSAVQPIDSTEERGQCPFDGVLGSSAPGSLLKRSAIIAYGILAYTAFVGTFLYTIGFVTGFVVPKSLRSGEAAPLLQALLMNSVLLGAFAMQHTVMARKWFKAWIMRYIPGAMERSTFVLAACAILIAMFALWHPMPQTVWRVGDPLFANIITGASFTGFLVVFYSSFLINHFDLFGMRQVMLSLRGRPYPGPVFRVKGLYRFIRHPLMLGFVIAFWATPVMTLGHLLFAAMTTGYILIGIRIEERDLIADLGEDYLAYKARVRGLLPIPLRKAL